MQKSILPLMRCPACRQPLTFGTLNDSLVLCKYDKDEPVLEGQLACRCGRSYSIRDGVPDLIYVEEPRSSDREFVQQSNEDECRFSVKRLSRLSHIERRHFWFVGRRALIARLLKRYLGDQAQLILDLGCGTGFMLEILMQLGHRVIGLDQRPEGLRAVNRVLPQSWLLQAEATRLPLIENAFDAVMLLDVLEHADDQKLLAEVRRVLRPGGLALITVPALPWLWSYRDKDAGHLRRYTLRQLTSLLSGEKFQVLEISYYQFLLFPIILVFRLFGKKGQVWRDFEDLQIPVLNKVLTWINVLEAKLGMIVPWPWGSSLVVVCRRRKV